MKITKIDQLFIKQWLYSFFVVLCALLSLLTIFDLLAGISSKKGFNEVVQQVLLSLPSRWVQIDGLTGLLAGVFTFIQLGKHSEWVIMRQLNFSPLRTFTYLFLFSVPLLITHHFFTEKLILKNELKLLELKKKEDVEQSSWFIAKKKQDGTPLEYLQVKTHDNLIISQNHFTTKQWQQDKPNQLNELNNINNNQEIIDWNIDQVVQKIGIQENKVNQQNNQQHKTQQKNTDANNLLTPFLTADLLSLFEKIPAESLPIKYLQLQKNNVEKKHATTVLIYKRWGQLLAIILLSLYSMKYMGVHFRQKATMNVLSNAFFLGLVFYVSHHIISYLLMLYQGAQHFAPTALCGGLFGLLLYEFFF